MKELYASDGAILQVSDCDFPYLCGFNWSRCHNVERSRYYKTERAGSRLYLHHAVLELMGVVKPKGYLTDHKDRDKTNNQRNNLRIVTIQQSNINTTPKKNGLPRGVSRVPSGGYEARVSVCGKQKYLGVFKNPGDAYAAYVAAAKKYHGEFAQLH